jgi:polyisoprenyl-phosphate glycosyltransferase
VTEPRLSIVVPMYNEAEIARDTVARLLAAGESTCRDFEVLAVDDGSRDGTAAILAELAAADPRVRTVGFARNQGHFPATQAGLEHARGEVIVVLDADLQTPPELIPELVETLERAPAEVTTVFGVTSTRDDPPVLLAGQAVFYFLQTRLSRNPIPRGASSFFSIRRDVARRIARLPLRSGNVGAVVAALGLAAESVLYAKPASYRHDSRLGLRGHLREAIGSFALTGVLTRLAAVAAGLALVAAAAGFASRHPEWATAALVVALASTAVAVGSERFVRRSLDGPAGGAIG